MRARLAVVFAVTLLGVACAARERPPTPPRPRAERIERPLRTEVFRGELLPGAARELTLEVGTPVDLALDVRVPGPVRLTVSGDGTLSLASSSGPGAHEVVEPLAAGRHLVRLRGAGPVVVTAAPGPGARATPEPMRPGTLDGRLAPGGAHWLALTLPGGGAWTIDAEGGARVALAVFRDRRQLAWSSPDDGARLTLDLDPGEVLVRVSDSSGQGGPFVVRARRVEGAAPDAPAVLRDDDAPAQEWTTRLEAGRTRWLSLSVTRRGAFVVEAQVDDGALELELARGRLVLATARGAGAARLAGWLDPGPHVVRVSGHDGATIRVRFAPGAHDPGRPLLHLLLRPVPAVPVALGRSSLGPGGAALDDPLASAEHERPRTVTLPDGLLVSAHEVTQRAFAAVLGRAPSSRPGDDLLPAHDVTLADARAFCAALTALVEGDPFWGRYAFRLPTEDEWEACCRAGARAPIAVETSPANRRPFAARLEELAWFQSHRPPDAGPGPFEVGGRAPNAWGLFDVHGNVAEWCLPSPTLPAPPAGLAPLRGGSWTTEYRGCRASNRDLVPVSFASASTGFRVVAAPR
jgi:formylglycine-generating enzyme required for sulfatase activity